MNAWGLALSRVFDTSLRVTIALGLLVLLRPVLRKYAGNGVLPFLWLIAAARLLFPWPVHAPWTVPIPPWVVTAERFTGTDGTRPTVQVRVIANAEKVGMPGGIPPARAEQPVSSVSSWHGDVWSWIWVAGMLASLLRYVNGWRQTRRWAARATLAEDDPRLRHAFESIPVSWRRGVTFHVTDALSVPTLAGIAHAQIWIPRGCLERLDGAELRHVLLHEIGHARRHDLLAQCVWTLACCLHWFNPFVWMAARLARDDRELACDAWVLSRGNAGDGENFVRAYGDTLLKVVQGFRTGTARGWVPIGVEMAASRRNLAVRVRQIASFRLIPSWRVFGAVVLGAAVVVVFTMSGVEPPPHSGEPSPQASATPTPAPVPSPGSPIRNPATIRLEFQGKMVGLSRSAIHRLAAEKAELPGLESVIDALSAAFDQPGTDENPAGKFSVTQILAPADYLNLLRKLNQTKGVDLLSAPHVTTKPDQKATIEIVREFLYPTKLERSNVPGGTPAMTPTKFEKKNVGLTLSVEGGLSPSLDEIDLIVKWELAELEGWVDPHGKPLPSQQATGVVARPVFSTQSTETAVTMKAGTTLLLGNPRRAQGSWRWLKEPEPADADSIVLNFITVNLVTMPSAAGNSEVSPPPPPAAPEGSKPPGSTPLETPAVKGTENSSLPRGTAVPGKPGFVTSPYAPKDGYIDIRGFAPGTEVRDPYTGKLFAVP